MNLGTTSDFGFLQRPWVWGLAMTAWLLVLLVVSGYDGLYGQDAYCHLNYARDIQSFWHDGTPLGTYQWPRLYAFLGALWLWGDPLGWMQCLAVAGSVLAVTMTIRLLQAALPTAHWIAPLTFAFVGLSPLLVRNSLSVMADAPALGMVATALWLGARYVTVGRVWRLGMACFFAGCAVFFRYPAALVLLLPMLHWGWVAARRKEWLGILVALPCLLVAALPQLLLPQAAGEGLDQPFQHQHFTQWRLANYFGSSFVQKDGQNAYPVFNLLAALGVFWHPRYLGLGFLGGFALLFRKRLQLPRINWLAMGAILVNVLFLAGIPFQNPRFSLLELPFAALLLGAAWQSGWVRILPRPSWRIWAFGLLLAVQTGLCWRSCQLFFRTNANERKMATDLSAFAQDGQRLYEMSLEAMLQARRVPVEAVSMWDGPVPAPRAGDLLAFNLEAFQHQFEGMWPMKNWEFLHQGHSVLPVKQWKEGWVLYAIQ